MTKRVNPFRRINPFRRLRRLLSCLLYHELCWFFVSFIHPGYFCYLICYLFIVLTIPWPSFWLSSLSCWAHTPINCYVFQVMVRWMPSLKLWAFRWEFFIKKKSIENVIMCTCKASRCIYLQLYLRCICSMS